MIHGSARDFKGDPSGTLYLSHTNMPLSQEDKALGSSAGFGDEEVLIPARIDYSVDIAVAHLRRYFPNLPRSELDILLNCRHDSYNEDTIIIKSGSPFREVHLLLSGVLESLDPEGRVLNSVSSGSLVGEFECLDDSTAPTTLRSRTMVETLSIPGEVYREFAARNALEADTARYREVGAFLRACPLFSDMMSLASFADIAASAVLVRYEDGEKVGGDPGESLHLIVSGSVNLHAGGRRVMDLGRGDVFGEESLVASACCIFEASSVGETIAYVISPAIVRRMPVLLWKLREIFVRRLVAARTSFDFSWRPEYSVGIPLVDEQHRRLFSLLDGLARQASNPATCPDVAPAIVEIKAFALEHFATEEGLMLKREYPDYESHARRHRAIIADLEAWEMDLLCGSEKSAAEFCEFLADWILRHTLSVDRHYIGRIG
jgi:hemerythrin